MENLNPIFHQSMELKFVMEPNGYLICMAQTDIGSNVNVLPKRVFQTTKRYINGMGNRRSELIESGLKPVKLLCELQGTEMELEFVILDIDDIIIGAKTLNRMMSRN